MLTPYFECHQDEEYIYIDIKVSHIRFDAVGVQIIVEDELFIFSLSPYYLRLRFPFKLIDDEERSKADYESKEEKIKVKIPKLNKGEFFPDLEFSQKLLARSGEIVDSNGNPEVVSTEELLKQIGVNSKDETLLKEVSELTKEDQPSQQSGKGPLIQDITEPEQSDLIKAEEEGMNFNWEINQTLNQDELSLKIKYGFDNQYDSIIGVSISNGNDINELNDPEHTTSLNRIKERLSRENFKFDPEYYAADFMTTKYSQDDEYSNVKLLLQWENPFLNDSDQFTQEENAKMLELPSKSYLITNPKPLYYTILSLVFSYCFEIRQTEGDLNTESAWSIGKLTPQISFLDQDLYSTEIYGDEQQINMLKLVVVTSIRRSLCYPLNRNFELSFKSWIDTVKFLRQGKRKIIKLLLKIHEIYRFHDVYYVYNKILIDDLINWLIKDSKNNDFILKSLGEEVFKILQNDLNKKDIIFEKLDLEDPEAEITLLNIKEIEDIAEDMYLNQEN
ncbi:hypothetical protein WICMUC_000239 [Wickerhamomyces mucosus]|uniref:CS domain-containing protein n=1 Tax=Wickerhamomyces mucosus TaxID=1378264 RepID=A0A9P8PZT5_9ASCO|nr:hypothetical protein WICMUC_000239 [Wickerhamomyces mucosus]